MQKIEDGLQQNDGRQDEPVVPDVYDHGVGWQVTTVNSGTRVGHAPCQSAWMIRSRRHPTHSEDAESTRMHGNENKKCRRWATEIRASNNFAWRRLSRNCQRRWKHRIDRNVVKLCLERRGCTQCLMNTTATSLNYTKTMGHANAPVRPNPS